MSHAIGITYQDIWYKYIQAYAVSGLQEILETANLDILDRYGVRQIQ